MKPVGIIFSFLFLMIASAGPAGESVSFDVRDADALKISEIQLILAEAARILELDNRNAESSDLQSISRYGSRVVPISISAHNSLGSVQILLRCWSSTDSIVSKREMFEQFNEVDAFIWKELSARVAGATRAKKRDL